MTKTTQKYGLIGYPIAHSGSPALFQKAYRGKWAYDLIEEQSFEKAWDIFLKEYTAINITAPFKEKAAAKAELKNPEVQSTGSANIVIRTENGLKAFNSDYLGLQKIIREINNIKKVLVVGYGGAGKAAAQAALDLGLDVCICNRSSHGNPNVLPLEEIKNQQADLLIYCLPLLIPEIKESIEKGCFLYVLEGNYRNPALRELIPLVCTYIPGEKWLLEQAICGYQLLTGEEPEL